MQYNTLINYFTILGKKCNIRNNNIMHCNQAVWGFDEQEKKLAPTKSRRSTANENDAKLNKHESKVLGSATA